MKITDIQTSNFLGARAVDVKLTKPVALFAGHNCAGKSSVQEAVRMALTGETVRVGLKKDYAALVTEGQESGFVEVHADDSIYSVVLPAGKGMHADLPALTYVLDAQRFARLDPNERRAFLFGLMGLETDGKAVKERLTATVAPDGAKWTPRGCDPAKVESIAPFLRAGFDAAQKEAQGKARECKASWKTTTGGEAYGSVKAASWQATKPEVKADELAQARADLVTVEAEIETETKRLGELQGRARQVAEQAASLNGLRQKAGMYSRIADKLERDKKERDEWKVKVETLRALSEERRAATDAPKQHACPDCGAVLMIVDGELQPWIHEGPSKVVSAGDAAKLPEYERALTTMENAVANGDRDLAAADAAARTLKDLEDVSGENECEDTDIGALEQRIAAIKLSRRNMQDTIRSLEDAERHAADADEKTKKATALHADVQAWEAIADALAPDGIPGEMLAEALEPINARLEQSAADAEWPRMMIDTDMSILKRHKDQPPRPYAMLSESEKWRADAMIAEAIAHLSDVRLLVLDRFDVLDLKGREDLIAWLDIMAQDGEIDTALIFGTLKALPAQLPETIEAFWIENGVVGQMEQAA